MSGVYFENLENNSFKSGNAKKRFKEWVKDLYKKYPDQDNFIKQVNNEMDLIKNYFYQDNDILHTCEARFEDDDKIIIKIIKEDLSEKHFKAHEKKIKLREKLQLLSDLRSGKYNLQKKLKKSESMRGEKITPEIKDAYQKAIVDYPKQKIPTPKQYIKKPKAFQKEFNNYLEKIYQMELRANDKYILLKNSYVDYMKLITGIEIEYSGSKDNRITEEMKTLFQKALEDNPDMEIHDPKYVIDNMEEIGKLFSDYLTSFYEGSQALEIKKAKLDTPYIKYYTLMTGIEVDWDLVKDPKESESESEEETDSDPDSEIEIDPEVGQRVKDTYQVISQDMNFEDDEKEGLKDRLHRSQK